MKKAVKLRILVWLVTINLILNIFSIPPVQAQADSDVNTSGLAFGLQIGGVIDNYFTECTGIGSENEIVEHRVILPDRRDGVQKLPGRLKWNNIILKRKITNNTDMWAWRKQVEDGKIADARKNISIVMYDNAKRELAKWNLANAWPARISTSVDSGGRITEEIELVYEEAERTVISDHTLKLAKPVKPVLVNSIATWTAVADENKGYCLQLYKDGVVAGAVVEIAHGAALSYDFTTSMTTPGSYTVAVTARGTGGYTDSDPSDPSFPQVIVDPSRYAITAIANQTLTELTAGFDSGTQEEKTITITKTGTGELAGLTTALSGVNAGDFDITQPLLATLNESTPSTTFTVKAKDGLAAGSYTGTVTVSATDMTDMTFTVTQVVKAPPIADASISPRSVSFDLNAPADITTTVTWNSAQSVLEVVYGAAYLSGGTDYSVAGDVLTIKKAYISSLNLTDGASAEFEILFDSGDSTMITVNALKGYLPGTDAAISDLKVGGVRVEGFAVDKYSYTLQLPYNTQPGSAAADVRAVPNDPKAAVKITQAAAIPGSAIIEVIAEDGVTQLTYTVDITLAAPSSNASLSSLTLSTGTLNQVFTPDTTVYSSRVNYSIYSITVTTAAADNNATVKVNGQAVDSGHASQPISLSVGENTITILVTAQNEELTKLYTITVNRALLGKGSSSRPSISTTPSKDGKTTTSSTTVKAETNSATGRASAEVEAGVMTVLTDKAKECETAGQKAVVEIKVEAPTNAKTVEVEIPRAAFDKVADITKADVKVNAGLGTITFNAKAVDAISGEAVVGDISISIARVDSSALPKEMQNKIANRPVFDFSVRAGTTEISNFGGGNAKISIPYTLKAGEDKNAIVVYYIDSEGNLKTVRGKYDSASGTVNFTTSHFSKYAVGYNEVNFNDVANNAWHKEAVGFIAARGITTGTGNGTYSPEDKLTRGQYIVMMLRAYGIDPDENPAGGSIARQADNFADAGSSYYTKYLATAKRMGIASGTGNNLFAPDQAITRQEMFTLLYRTLKTLEELPVGAAGNPLDGFGDEGKIAPWAKEAMTLFAQTRTVSGSGGNLTPTATSTRAQMAQVLYNLLAK